MRPFLDNPPSSYRTEKHLYSNCCLLSTCYTLLNQKDAGGFIQITFKQNSFLLTDFYNRFLLFYSLFFILIYIFLCYPGSLLLYIYYYIFLRFGFFFVSLVLWHFRSILFFHFHSVMYFFLWCFAFTSEKSTQTIHNANGQTLKEQSLQQNVLWLLVGFCLEDWLVDLISNNNNHNNMCCTRYYTNNNNNEQKKA